MHYDLRKNGFKKIKLLDGDNLRNMMTEKFGYSVEERIKLINRYIKIINNENEKGFIVIISTVSHLIKMRGLARDKLSNFMEINLICDPKICAGRDYKNIYDKINDNSDECLPGVTEPYEISKQADLVLDTGQNSIEYSRKKLYRNVKSFLESLL